MAREYKKHPWKQFEYYFNVKFKWYQKISLWVQCKIYNIKNYYTNPYRVINRKIK
ncbi:protein of unknown function [Ruminococcaceae bacterium BL-6]|nr:protein of unknown function [Ruminococcaceae bacterium BL-6]